MDECTLKSTTYLPQRIRHAKMLVLRIQQVHIAHIAITLPDLTVQFMQGQGYCIHTFKGILCSISYHLLTTPGAQTPHLP